MQHEQPGPCRFVISSSSFELRDRSAHMIHLRRSTTLAQQLLRARPRGMITLLMRVIAPLLPRMGGDIPIVDLPHAHARMRRSIIVIIAAPSWHTRSPSLSHVARRSPRDARENVARRMAHAHRGHNGPWPSQCSTGTRPALIATASSTLVVVKASAGQRCSERATIIPLTDILYASRNTGKYKSSSCSVARSICVSLHSNTYTACSPCQMKSG